MRNLSPTVGLGALVLAGGLVHLQQWFDGFSAIPVVGPMFVANVVVSVAVAFLLLRREEPVWVVAAGIVAAGSLVAIAVSMGPGLFGYVSAGLGPPEVLAVIFEGAALLLAGSILVRRSQRPSPS